MQPNERQFDPVRNQAESSKVMTVSEAAWELRDETCEPGFLYLQYLVWTVTWELITNLAATKNLLEHIFRGRLLENSWESKIMKEKHN